MLYSIKLTEFHCMIAFTSFDNGQYLNWNYLSSQWRQFWNWAKLSYQVVSQHNQKVRTKVWITQELKDLLTWNKKHFLSFLKGFRWNK